MEKIIDNSLFRIDAALTEFRYTLADSKPDEAAVDVESDEQVCEASESGNGWA